MRDDDSPRPATNPWRTLSSREVYRNPWIRVREDEVLRPSGQPGIYGVVEMKIATAIVTLTEDENVVLVGQWRYPFDEYSWEIVEGAADDGESPRDAAARELREEAGLGADHWQTLGKPVALSNSVTNEVAHIFLARELHPLPAAPDETELLKLRQIPLKQAVRMATDGEIIDALSVIGLLRAARWLNQA
ncbi:MAG: NUDIX hydrolase [Myxococcota bacterium]